LSAAQARRLNIIEYGCTSDCEFQLIDYQPQTRQVTASLRGIKIRYELGAEGEHMALNSIAILAAVTALNYPLNDALQKLSVFNALSGRGEQSQLTIDGKPITLIDDAYNANTGSMKAALENLATHTTAPRRIAVLGQMAELGLNAEQYHTDLAEFIAGLPVDKVFVTGEHYKNFWQCLPDAIKGAYAPSMEELKTALREQIEEQDTILFKGSNSTKIHELVTWIKNIAAQ
jgi:UDP-N-acetylmuramyl pentapeptide synthase